MQSCPGSEAFLVLLRCESRRDLQRSVSGALASLSAPLVLGTCGHGLPALKMRGSACSELRA